VGDRRDGFGYLLPFDLTNRDFKLPRDFAHWQVRSFASRPRQGALHSSRRIRRTTCHRRGASRAYPTLGARGPLTLSPGWTEPRSEGGTRRTLRRFAARPGTGKIRHTGLWERGAFFAGDGQFLITTRPGSARARLRRRHRQGVRRLKTGRRQTCSSRGIIQTLISVARQCRYGASRTGRSGRVENPPGAYKIDDPKPIRGAAVSPDGKL